MPSKIVVVKKKTSEKKAPPKRKRKSNKPFAKKVVGNPSKFIGCGIFKYYEGFIHTDLIRGVKVERKEGESDKDLEKRAVKDCYAQLKLMVADYKNKATELGFKVK